MRRAERASHNLRASGRCAMQISPSPQAGPRRCSPGRPRPGAPCAMAHRAGPRVRRLPGRHAARPCAALSGCRTPRPCSRSIVSSRSPGTPRRGSCALVAWRRACRALIAADGPPASLRAARSARIDLLPHQLEPALAISARARHAGAARRRSRPRQDDSGRPHRVRAAGARRRSNASSSSRRRPARSMGAGARRSLRDRRHRRRRTRPAAARSDAADRRQPVAHADRRRRVDRLRQAAGGPAGRRRRAAWDLVIVDEAHACAGDSDRRAAVQALASRAAYVLLLTATPHSGDRESFLALCAIGAAAEGASSATSAGADQPLLVFRRTRADVGIGTARRVHIVRVRPSRGRGAHARAAARATAMRCGQSGRRCTTLARAVRAAQARVLERVVAGAVGRAAARRRSPRRDRSAGEQMALPLGDPHGELHRGGRGAGVAGGSAPVGSGARTTAADGAAPARARRRGRETKVAALVTLLRRARQPAVVFTEYRDTLLHVRQSLAASRRSCCTAA